MKSEYQSTKEIQVLYSSMRYMYNNTYLEAYWEDPTVNDHSDLIFDSLEII